jgi:hypothetical protein
VLECIPEAANYSRKHEPTTTETQVGRERQNAEGEQREWEDVAHIQEGLISD